MPDLRPVTDPELLRQLDAPSEPVPVTDPTILAQLNAPDHPPTIWDKLGQTWPAQMAKELYSAVQLPGDVYAGRTQVDPNNPEFMNRITTLGGIAPVGTLPSVMSMAPSVKQLVTTGGKQIDKSVESGQIFHAPQVQEGINTIRDQLPTRRVSTATHAAIDALEQKVQSGQPITFRDIAQTRDELLSVQRNAAKSTSETAATDLQASTVAKHALDDFIVKPTGTPEAEQFIAGNTNVSAGKTAEGLDRRLYASELRAASRNSGQNIGNTIKQNVTSLLLGKDARTLTPEVRQQAENLVYGTNPENFMRHWGNVLGGGGGLGQALTIAGSGLGGYVASGGSPTVAGIAAAGGPIIGSLLKHGANETAISHLEALSNALRGNTPLGAVVNRGDFLGGKMPSETAAKAALIRALLAHQAQQPAQP